MLALVLAVRQAPGLKSIEMMRTNIGQAQLDFSPYVPLLLVAVSLAAGGSVVKRARFIVYAALVSGLGWALAGATQLPLWLIGQRLGIIEPPEPGVILLGAISVAALLLHLFIDALKEFQDASIARGVPLNLVEWDQRRVAITYFAAVAAVFIVGLVLAGLFQGPFEGADWVPPMTGAEWGTWILVLVALLLGGVLLILGVHERGSSAKKDE
jgi:hypothetical protein